MSEPRPAKGQPTFDGVLALAQIVAACIAGVHLCGWVGVIYGLAVYAAWVDVLRAVSR